MNIPANRDCSISCLLACWTLSAGLVWQARANGVVLDTVLASVSGQQYQFTLLECTGEPSPECEPDSTHGPGPFIVRAHRLTAEGQPIGDSVALARVPELPLNVPNDQPLPIRACLLAWDPDTQTLWAVSSSSLDTSLYVMLLPITIGSAANGTALEASIPEVSAGGMSFGENELGAADALPQVHDVSFENHTLTIRLQGRDPDRTSEDLPAVGFNTETHSWSDGDLAAPPADPPPSDPE